MAKFLIVVVLLVLSLGVSGADCKACHGPLHDSLRTTPHAVLQGPDGTADACTQCHVQADAHLVDPRAGNILAFLDEPSVQQDAACASCHSDSHNAGQGLHARAGVACTDCHSIHRETPEARPPAGFEDIDTITAGCVGCHEDTLAQFAFNERHRLVSVGCTSCHDPHATANAAAPGGTHREACVDCHADKDGPFLFEHDAARVDGCLACHTPHGSSNRHLLTHQESGELCYSCHATVPQFHLGFSPSGPPRFGGKTMCTNCHVTVHGSNLDRNFLR